MKKLIRSLKLMKKKGISGIKQSLEDEGATFKDIMIMRKVTKAAKVDLNIKIGGCEAKNDIFFCKKIGVDSIVAPMVESEYALKKFIQCAGVNKNIALLINLETNLSLKNLDKIIKSQSFKHLDGIVIGRSDLAGSLNLSKDKVNSKLIFNKVQKAFRKVKKNNKKMIIKMGGSITGKSSQFINKLFSERLLNKIETRNIEINLSQKTINNLENLITEIFKFEIEWLKFKLNMRENKKNKLIIKDYLSRIKEMKKRLDK
tara:strand:- start:126 stop:902 length:777 start_codon:yes stop_codon:yes gene_type:complete